MPISFDCPACGKHYSLKTELAGKAAKCGCGNVMTVPANDDARSSSHHESSPPTDVSAEELAPIEVGDEESKHQTLGDRLKSAGQLAAKQAERLAIVKVKLPAAYASLGNDIYLNGRYREELPELYKRLDEIMAMLGSLKQGESTVNAPAVQTFADKTAKTAGKMKAKAKSEILAVDAKSVLRQIGQSAFEKHGASSGPETLTTPIKDFLSRVRLLETEAAKLSVHQEGQILTPKRILTGAVALVITLGAYWIYSSMHQSGIDAATQTEIALLDMKSKEAEAQRNAREVQREREAEQREEKERLEQTQRAAAAELDEKRRDQRLRTQEADQAKLDQKQRAQMAARLFGKVDIHPKIIFSRTLASGNPRIELRGEITPAIEQAMKSWNWLKLIGLLLDNADYNEFPGAEFIDQAYSVLMDYEFDVLIRTTAKYDSKNGSGEWNPVRLCRGEMSGFNKYRVSCNNDWTRHPDGVGWVFTWRLKNGEVVIASTDGGDGGQISDKVRDINQRLVEKNNVLEEKRRMGELTDDIVSKMMDEAYTREWEGLKAFALNQ